MLIKNYNRPLRAMSRPRRRQRAAKAPQVRRTPRRRLHFERLDDTQFEEFAFDLLDQLGFVNLDWRKGTGKRSSPADSGRDIVCESVRTDVDGTIRLERWFVDCKHVERGLPATELQSLLTWSQAERPDTALFVVSNFLSNSAKDNLAAYEAQNRPSFKIRVWERPMLEKLAGSRLALLRRYNLVDEPIRSLKALLRAEEEFFDKVWYDRHMGLMQRVREGRTEVDPKILKGALAAGRRVRKKYGKNALGPWTDFEWGMLNGKLSALRWVLGSEWDFLDT